MIAHARQVFHATAADHDHRVLLQIVPFPRNIRRYLHAVGQPHARHFAQRRVWFFRRHGRHLYAHPSLKGRCIQHRPVFEHIKPPAERRRFGLILADNPAMFDQLGNGRHTTMQEG